MPPAKLADVRRNHFPGWYLQQGCINLLRELQCSVYRVLAWLLGNEILIRQSSEQVEPVKWSPQRMRKVLNNAILSGNVADDMIACADQALGEGFEGSLSR